MAAPEKKKGKVGESVPEVKVVELFAGVGGFRIGLERASRHFKTVWFNQWEPGQSDVSQHAWKVYVDRFENEDHSGARALHTNTNIAAVDTKLIPQHDLLVGGFPCQDYSVARTLSQAHGLVGKKGVLWWEIYRILREKGSRAPKYLMLENVDRLLKSPVAQRGRDFAIMLASLEELGYAVEWRVINAADYGMPQRRRRVYILGYRRNASEHAQLKSDPVSWLLKKGVMPKAMPIVKRSPANVRTLELDSAQIISEIFNKGGKLSPFANAGVMVGGKVWTAVVEPSHDGMSVMLGDVLEPEEIVPAEYFISKDKLPEWQRLKGGKRETRVTKTGFEYEYSEGPVSFPDHLDKPSRTIVTGEGGKTASRFKHVVRTPSGRLRRLMPVELERLNMFPDRHTAGPSDARRAFFMGNALVVGIVERLGKELYRRVRNG